MTSLSCTKCKIIFTLERGHDGQSSIFLRTKEYQIGEHFLITSICIFTYLFLTCSFLHAPAKNASGNTHLISPCKMCAGITF